MATVKHWPGGGAVTDTHVAGGKTPRWSKLKKRDLVPFQTAFAAGVGGVMVRHAVIPGLTGGIPGTQSRARFSIAQPGWRQNVDHYGLARNGGGYDSDGTVTVPAAVSVDKMALTSP